MLRSAVSKQQCFSGENEEDGVAAQQYSSALQEIKAGNYSIELKKTDIVSKSIDDLVSSLREEGIAELDRMVNISIEINETAILSAHMMSHLSQIDDETKAVATAAEEMVSSIQTIGTFSENIVRQARHANDTVATGAQSSAEAEARMTQITISVKDGVQKVDTLSRFSEKIGDISLEIKKIADQTNLLALNATIEAARSGEAGKGFAVVANEVKQLSSQTRKATDEISTIIEQLQGEVSSVRQSMDETSDAVASGQEAIQELSSDIKNIQEQFTTIHHSSEEISSILMEQSDAAQEVAENIAHVADRSVQSRSDIEKIAMAMDSVETFISQHIAKLAELNLPGKVIKLAKSDHVIWKKRLANMMSGRLGLRVDELADHHNCRLGKWYDAVQDPKYKNDPVFKSLVEPHKLVHAHGIKAVEHYNNNDLTAALAEIEMVEKSSKEVLAILETLDKA